MKIYIIILTLMYNNRKIQRTNIMMLKNNIHLKNHAYKNNEHNLKRFSSMVVCRVAIDVLERSGHFYIIV